LEVFEHLPRRQTVRTIRIVKQLLMKMGIFIVGVPNELFVAALVKGIFRMMVRCRSAFDTRASNILRATFGHPPKRRPIKEIAPGLPYHFHHVGIDHRRLRDQLCEHFELVRSFGSLFEKIGIPLNSEIFFVMRKATRVAKT
jgi:hypothetical protein